MNVEQYCQEKAAKPGTDVYYSSRCLATKKQQAVIAVYAFHHEIFDIPHECNDVNIAHKKLDWWYMEIENLFIGIPTHPVTKALQKINGPFQLPKEIFLEFIDGVIKSLDKTEYSNFEELLYHCHQTTSLITLLVNYICRPINHENLNFAKDVGTILRLVQIICNLRQDVKLGKIFLPQHELNQNNIALSDIFSLKISDNLRETLKQQANRARSCYQIALQKLPKTDRYSQLCNIIMAELALKLLDEIEKDNFDVFRKHYALTPLYKLFLSWRINWREFKHK